MIKNLLVRVRLFFERFQNRSGNRQEEILHGNVYKILLVLAVPLMMNQLFQTLYTFVDTYWVSKIGSEQLGAVSFLWPISYLITCIGIGMCVAGTALIAQYLGADNHYEARKTAGQLMSFTLLLSVFLGAIGFLCCEKILYFMGGRGILLQSCTIFLKVSFAGMPFTFIAFIYNAIRQAEGNMAAPMILGLLTNGLNMILDPVFIFIFHWGIGGAAFATILSQAIFGVMQVTFLFRGKNGLRIRVADLKPEFASIKHIFKVAVPSIIGMSMTAVGFGISNSLVISYGDATIAAMGIGNKFSSIIMVPIMGTGQALSTLVGQNLGANNIKRTRECIRASVVTCLIMTAVLSITVFFTTHSLVTIFTRDPEIMAQSIDYLNFLCVSCIFMTLFEIFMGVFRGSGLTRASMMMEVLRLWVIRLPMIVVLQIFIKNDPNIIWLSMVLSNALIDIYGFAVYKGGKWQKGVISRSSAENAEESALA